MARVNGINFNGQFGVVRSAASIIVADSATLTDANIPPTQGFSCVGMDTIFVACEITAGSSPTMTIEPLFRDPDAADGNRWKRLLVGSPPGVTLATAAVQSTGALPTDTQGYELRVYGWPLVFLRVSAVTNPGSTTAWNILAMPGKLRPRP